MTDMISNRSRLESGWGPVGGGIYPGRRFLLTAFARIGNLEDYASRVGTEGPMHFSRWTTRVIPHREPAIAGCVVEASLEYENLFRVVVDLWAEGSRV